MIAGSLFQIDCRPRTEVHSVIRRTLLELAGSVFVVIIRLLPDTHMSSFVLILAIPSIQLSWKIHLSPRRELGRLPPGYFVCERDLIARVRT